MDATTPGNSGETSKDFPKNGTGVPHDPVRECSHKETTSAEPPKASIDEPGGSRLLPSASRSENMCIRHKRMADEGATVRLQQVRTGARSSWGAANAIPHVGGGPARCKKKKPRRLRPLCLCAAVMVRPEHTNTVY